MISPFYYSIRISKEKWICAALLSAGLLVLTTHNAYAGIDDIAKFFGLDMADFVVAMLGYVMQMILEATAVLLSIAGAFLNVSIYITLHIKDFVDNTPAIYTIWKTIRDISGLFFIFLLLYAAIKMILGFDGGYGNLIKNIVIVGILINFSFFFTSLLIDASNVVSLAIYRAILPGATEIKLTNNANALRTMTSKLVQEPKKGSISDIFMQNLQIQTLYNPKDKKTGEAVLNYPRIVIVSIIGVIIMVTTALSFLLAAAAFVVRLVILLFLLAFSPIWFAAMVIPGLDEYSKKFTDQLKAQLIFMPVYLLLMYAALSILNGSNLIGAGYSNILTGEGSGTGWWFGFIVLAINFAMVIIMLNLPLVVAFAMGGMATSMINTKKWGAGAIWKNVGGYFGTRTLGRGAARLEKTFSESKYGNKVISRNIRAVTTGALAKSKMGAGRSYEELKKEKKDVVRREGEIARTTRIDQLTKTYGNPATIRSEIKELSEKAKLGLGADRLKNHQVAAHLKGSDFEAIKKSDEFTDVEKKEISDARTEALEIAVMNNDTETLKHMVDNMDGKDLLKFAGTVAAPGILTSANMISHLKSSQLQTLENEGLDVGIRSLIATGIRNHPTPHKSLGWINRPNNRLTWP